MKLIALIVVAVGLVGCAGVGSSVKPIASDTWKMHGGNRCYAVFPPSKDGLTLVTMNATDKYAMGQTYVMAYNPANAEFGLFYSGEKNASCNELGKVLNSPVIMPRVNLFTVTDDAWKAALGLPTADNVKPIADYVLEHAGADGTGLPNQYTSVIENGHSMVKPDSKVKLLKTFILPGKVVQPKDPSSVFAELKH